MKRMGLVKCNDRLEVVKVKLAYYTVQNLATLFDSTIEPSPFVAKVSAGEKAEGIVLYTFRQKGTDIPLLAFWDASKHPGNGNDVRRTTLEVKGKGVAFADPVWIDLVTGAIYRLPEHMIIRSARRGQILEDVPYYDAPVVVTERRLVMADGE